MFRGVQRAGNFACGNAHRVQCHGIDGVGHRPCNQALFWQIERDVFGDGAVGKPDHIARHPVNHLNIHIGHPQPRRGVGQLSWCAQDGDVRGGARLRGVVRGFRRHKRHVVLQVQRVHDELFALVDVHGAVVNLAHRARRIHGAKQAAVGDVHNRHLLAGPAAQRHVRVRRLRGDLPLQLRHGKVALPALAQETAVDQLVHHFGSTEGLNVRAGQRALNGRAVHMPTKQIRIGGIKHTVFHRLAQKRLRVMHQVGIHRVIARHQHRHRMLTPPARAPCLLTKRRNRPRKPRHHHSVQSTNVNAQLKCIGGGHAEQLALIKCAL